MQSRLNKLLKKLLTLVFITPHMNDNYICSICSYLIYLFILYHFNSICLYSICPYLTETDLIAANHIRFMGNPRSGFQIY